VLTYFNEIELKQRLIKKILILKMIDVTKINKIKFTFIIIVLINIFLRIPSLFQELPPYTFIDEDLYVNKAFKHYQKDALYIAKVNQIVYYLASGPSYFYTLVTNEKLSLEQFTILARFFGPVLLNSISAAIIFLIGHLLFKTYSISIIATGLFTFSPMVMGTSRILYPDHLWSICASMNILICLFYSKGIYSKKVNTFLMGFIAALGASIKISGIVLCLPSFLLITKHNFKKSKSDLLSQVSYLINPYVFLFFSIIVCFFVLNPIIITNGFQPFIDHINWKNSLYTKEYWPFLKTNNTYIFYTILLLFTTFGSLGFFFICSGVVILFNSNKTTLLFYIICPLLLIAILGRYEIGITRNIILGIPYVLFLLLYGFNYYLRKINNPTIKYLLIFFLLFEIIVKSGITFYYDLKTDSRILASRWIKKNVPAGSTIGQSKYMKNPIENFKNSDFLILDSWWSDLYDFNKHKSNQTPFILFKEPIINNLHFINSGGVPYNEKYLKYKRIIQNYDFVTTLNGYGPKVFIFKKN